MVSSVFKMCQEKLTIRTEIVAFLWVAVTLTICWMLWNVRSDAKKRQGSPCQTVGVIFYVLAAVIAVPVIMASSLSPVTLTCVQIAGLLALAVTDATPHLLGMIVIAWSHCHSVISRAPFQTQASTSSRPPL